MTPYPTKIDKEPGIGYVQAMPSLPWQVRLYNKSLMKKEKVRLIRKKIAFPGQRVLDLGSAQGTVSFQLKSAGGFWTHADLDLANLLTSRPLLGHSLVRVGDAPLPFKASAFDLMLALDYLEHVAGDERVVSEAHRLLRSGGRLVISTPSEGKGFMLTRLKKRLGLNPEIFGHLRPGYTLDQLAVMLSRHGFAVESRETYAKFFVEFFEILLDAFFIRRNRRHAGLRRTGSNSPQSAVDLQKNRLLFSLYGNLVYPFVYLFTRLDRLLWAKTGYATLVIGRKP